MPGVRLPLASAVAKGIWWMDEAGVRRETLWYCAHTAVAVADFGISAGNTGALRIMFAALGGIQAAAVAAEASTRRPMRRTRPSIASALLAEAGLWLAGANVILWHYPLAALLCSAVAVAELLRWLPPRERRRRRESLPERLRKLFERFAPAPVPVPDRS